jgi:hypothetical protein
MPSTSTSRDRAHELRRLSRELDAIAEDLAERLVPGFRRDSLAGQPGYRLLGGGS